MKNFKPVIWGLSTVVLLMVVIPLIRMVLAADPGVLRATVADPEVIQSIFLTLRSALWATIFCAIFGIPLAYALARWELPFKSVVQGIIDLPVMIPHTAAGIALLMVYGQRFFMGKAFSSLGISFVGTEAGISLAMAFVSLPFLVNAPLAWRAILSGGIMMWARGISEFGAVIVLAYHPMTAPVLIWERFEAYGLKYARPVAVFLILLCLGIFALLRGIAARKREA
ncbi:MAG: ABC transporter permease [Deltaproteobacteria bacterium]|nr:ABC transporter permease [Deltaproteobacteria bacterium]